MCGLEDEFLINVFYNPARHLRIFGSTARNG
jgi:hypothetical protein